MLLISLSDCSLAKKKSAQVEIITEVSRDPRIIFFHSILLLNQHKPEHCPYTAQNGDTLLVHYVVCDGVVVACF